LDLSFEASAKD
jgi:archaellum component FlaF (FlaF/FlaG flagellin family)